VKILSLSNVQIVANEGSGQVVLAVTEGLRRKGHQVDLFGPNDYEVCLWMRPRANSYRKALGMWQLAAQRLRNENYDVIQIYGSEGWLTLMWITRQFKKWRPLCVLYSNGLEPHAYQHLNQVKQVNRRWWQLDQSILMEKGFRSADGLVVVSNFDREFALGKGYQPDDHVITIENGLDKAFLNLPMTFEREPIIGFCGNWLPIKGIDLLCSALPQVLHEFPKARVHLIGMRQEFRKEDWFPADVAPQIDVLPWLDDKSELIKQYQQLSIAVRPSFYESFGLVTAEAMACGAAVITSGCGFGNELRDGEDALVLKTLSVEILTDACRRLLRDEGLRRRLAEQGYRRVQNLRWEESIARLESAYHRWLTLHNPLNSN
jgi:glycosyltransferase involved in cell wall biosynthesis